MKENNPLFKSKKACRPFKKFYTGNKNEFR